MKIAFFKNASRFPILALIVGAGTTGLVACGGGRAAVAGQQCARAANPISMNPPQQKLDMTSFTLPDGEYRLIRAAMHFHGDPTEKAPEGFQVMIRSEVPKGSADAVPVARTECFRNAQVSQMHHALVPTISRVLVEGGQIKETETRDLGFNIDDTGHFDLATGPSLRKTKSPREILARGSDEFFILQHGADFEIRTNGRGVNGNFTATMLLQRVR